MDARMRDTRSGAWGAPENGRKNWLFRQVALPLSRWSLAIVYVWYGVLKLIGRSPVADVVAKATAPLPPRLTVPLMGVWETLMGLGMLTQTTARSTVPFLLLHIAGTFTFLLRRPQESFQEENPLLLTQRGEFIIKNLILAAVGLVIGTQSQAPQQRIGSSGKWRG